MQSDFDVVQMLRKAFREEDVRAAVRLIAAIDKVLSCRMCVTDRIDEGYEAMQELSEAVEAVKQIAKDMYESLTPILENRAS